MKPVPVGCCSSVLNMPPLIGAHVAANLKSHTTSADAGREAATNMTQVLATTTTAFRTFTLTGSSYAPRGGGSAIQTAANGPDPDPSAELRSNFSKRTATRDTPFERLHAKSVTVSN